ncbi:MAG TPA: protease pro-enzyme activation domain-containing protein [Stellaceae bacterium]|nr:protease pro-enzyme activation domain-containing protein [Stellaceae bacterium]
MRRILANTVWTIIALAAASGGMASAMAQNRAAITKPIEETQLVALAGNTRPEANAANDRGAVADSLPIAHMLLVLRRSAAQEAALDQTIDDLQDSHSPNYHHWLTAAEFGARFGAAAPDLSAITGWLGRHGFRINNLYPNRLAVDFSGTAGQVRAAFHTEIHHLDVDGAAHIANISDPKIPAALAPAVTGVASLNDFRPAPQYTFAARCASASVLAGTCYAMVPADLATIYNLQPLHRAGIVGTRLKIDVIENSDLYKVANWYTFRAAFGLDRFPGSFEQIHPEPAAGAGNCQPPGVTTSDTEATLDAEWASAAAPGAAIKLASCADTAVTSGHLIAVENVVNATATPDIISISSSECEAAQGAAGNAAWAFAFQQAVAEGISVFVSAGDFGAAACDPHGGPPALHGTAVNGIASTPYDVAVGGTDFADTYTGTNRVFWRSTNTLYDGSAKSYIPEIPWNSSCGSELLANYLSLSPRTYGAQGFCNKARSVYVKVSGGAGGRSGCATGAPSMADIVSGTCAGYRKPFWQRQIRGNPADGVRDLPDVALYASPGTWGHRYVTCFSDPNNGGSPCTGPVSGWAGSGGTSYATPIMAGIQALVDQHAGGRQGNPAPIYYWLAAEEYAWRGNGPCNSARGIAMAGDCIFHNVTIGDTDVPCAGTTDCYLPGGATGVLSTSDKTYRPAFVAASGWNFATGLGSVDAANLVKNWPR